jgi:hypothetical protein
VLNDPVNLVDPLGLQACGVTVGTVCPPPEPGSIVVTGTSPSGGGAGRGGGPSWRDLPELAKRPPDPREDQGADPSLVDFCARQADKTGRALGTIASFTVIGAQGGLWGAAAGFGVGVGTALFEERLGHESPAANSIASGVLEGRYGFLGSQYDRVIGSLFSDQAHGRIAGLVGGNVVFHIMKTGAITGAAGAAKWGFGAGAAYLAAYAAGFELTFRNCIKTHRQ